MKTLTLALIVTLFVGGNALANQPELGFRYLHLPIEGGFIEYDFRPDGVLLVFVCDRDGNLRSRADGTAEPIFSLERQVWSLEEGTLLIREDGKVRRLAFTQTEKTVSWLENTFRKTSRLEAFDFLQEYIKEPNQPLQRNASNRQPPARRS
ncbi:MAG: hypothetical protein QM760_16930 [Nibricoccus sp.]